MNIQKKVRHFLTWLARFAQLQLFLTIVSLPIFLGWGLPISMLSPLGNLLFGPILTIFLFLTSLIFFSELLYIPNYYLLRLLEHFTDSWLTIMHADCKTWLFGFIKPSFLCMIIIPIVAFGILLYKKTSSLRTSVVCLSLLFVTIGIYLKATQKNCPSLTRIACNRGNLTLLRSNDQIILIDPGYMGQRTNAASWAQYTLLPTMVKSMGCTTLDHLILLQPSSMAFQALERLCTLMQIKRIYIVYWNQDAKKSMLRNFMALKSMAKNKGISIIRFSQQPVSIPLMNSQDKLVITSLDNLIKTPDITFPALAVQGCIDNQEITIYSARYMKEKSLSVTKK